MPVRLRPTAPIAADAVLVGDPGRALLLAQALLDEPKMSNHARGLWGYSGATAGGSSLTIQSTGMGGPSAALVLTDLAKLGVRRAVRIGTCSALDRSYRPADLIVVEAARAQGGSATAFGLTPGEATLPDPDLTARLARELGEAGSLATVASFDAMPFSAEWTDLAPAAADMQTATVLAHGRGLGIAVAAILIVDSTASGERIDDETLEGAARRAGKVVLDLLSP